MDTKNPQTSLYSLITLDPTKRDIRLLRLLPGTSHDPVKAEVLQGSLENSPDFSVLSYSWGPESDKMPITVETMTESLCGWARQRLAWT